MRAGPSRLQRLAIVLGATALLSTPVLAAASLSTETGSLFGASLATATIALGCGLVVESRRWTLFLVVPSLAYLALVMWPG